MAAASHTRGAARGGPLTLDLHVAGGPYRPGDTVGGHLTVVTSGECKEINVCLAFSAASVDYSAIERTAAEQVLAEGFVREGQRLAFELALPADAPPSFLSPHGSLYWTVEAWCDRRGLDAHASRRFEVVSGR